MINKYSIPNGAKYFSSDGLQNYLLFQPFINYFITKVVKLIHGSQKECQEKVLQSRPQ